MTSTFKFIWGDREVLKNDNRRYKVGRPERCRKCKRKNCYNCTQQSSYRTRRDDNQKIGKLYTGD